MGANFTFGMKESRSSQVASRSLRKAASGVLPEAPSTAGVMPSMMAAMNSLPDPKTTTSILSFFGVEIEHELDGETIVAIELMDGSVTGGGAPAVRTTMSSAFARWLSVNSVCVTRGWNLLPSICARSPVRSAMLLSLLLLNLA